MRRTETVMTYDQWERRFKRQVKRYVKRKLNRAFMYLVMFFLITMPIWMFIDYILRGYTKYIPSGTLERKQT